MRERTVLIEKTAKRWKATQATGFSVLFLGLLLSPLSIDGSVVGYGAIGLLVVGCLILTYGTFGAWWNHA